MGTLQYANFVREASPRVGELQLGHKGIHLTYPLYLWIATLPERRAAVPAAAKSVGEEAQVLATGFSNVTH